MGDLEASARTWKAVQEIRDRFCEGIAALEGDYTAICAVDSREDDRCTVSGAGTLDLERAHQLLGDIVTLLREQHQMNDEQVIRFLMQIGVEVINRGGGVPDVLS